MTIGEKIKKEVKKYTEMYERMKKNPFYDNLNIDTLTLHDLRMNVYVAERVLEKVKKYVEKEEKEALDKGVELICEQGQEEKYERGA